MAIPKIQSYAMPTASDMPASKTQWSLEPQRAVLLVHDMQRYFVDFFDATLAPVPELIERIRQLLERCRALDIPVVYTAQPGDQAPRDRALLTDFWGPGLADDPALVGIVPELAPTERDRVYTKWRYSAFKRTPLESWMREHGRDQLLICGVYAHIGCLMTAAEAFMLDIQAFLVGDALADFSREEHVHALRYAAGRCAQVNTTAEVLRQLPVAAKPAALTPDQIRRDVAEQMRIDPAELYDEDNLLLMGLDSIRLMTLVERWRAEGAEVSFADLAEAPTLNEWIERLSKTSATHLASKAAAHA